MRLKPLNTESRPKQVAANILQSAPLARCVSVLSRHRIPSFDLIFDTSDETITPRIEAQLLFRLYESSEIRLVRKHLAGCDAIVDLGSSLGFTASHALTKMSPYGRFIAVEPNAALIPSLRRTLDSQAAGRSVMIENAAISYGPDRDVHLVVGTDNTASHLGEAGALVPALTLSEVLAKHGVDRFALLADIEGSEASVIFDESALDDCDRMVIELHETTYAGRRVGVEELAVGLLRRGFTVTEQQGPVFALAR